MTITGRDRGTINDWCKAGRYPGAYRDDTGRKAWHIPIRALVETGHLDPAQVVEVESTLESARESRKLKELRDRVAELEVTVQVHLALAEERLAMIEVRVTASQGSELGSATAGDRVDLALTLTGMVDLSAGEYYGRRAQLLELAPAG